MASFYGTHIKKHIFFAFIRYRLCFKKVVFKKKQITSPNQAHIKSSSTINPSLKFYNPHPPKSLPLHHQQPKSMASGAFLKGKR